MEEVPAAAASLRLLKQKLKSKRKSDSHDIETKLERLEQILLEEQEARRRLERLLLQRLTNENTNEIFVEPLRSPSAPSRISEGAPATQTETPWTAPSDDSTSKVGYHTLRKKQVELAKKAALNSFGNQRLSKLVQTFVTPQDKYQRLMDSLTHDHYDNEPSAPLADSLQETTHASTPLKGNQYEAPNQATSPITAQATQVDVVAGTHSLSPQAAATQRTVGNLNSNTTRGYLEQKQMLIKQAREEALRAFKEQSLVGVMRNCSRSSTKSAKENREDSTSSSPIAKSTPVKVKPAVWQTRMMQGTRVDRQATLKGSKSFSPLSLR
eukprot:GILK01012163.1.p1 GENE.GILK01012163.1~~GILK01012163.1.p1  ORF type:complete len:333 (-),score=45.78 GILK01012163.1:214-1188(-)